MEASVTSHTSTPMSSSMFNPKTFTNPVSFKLNEDNFMPWKHQALACIKANKMKDHLNKKKIPERYASKAYQSAEIET